MSWLDVTPEEHFNLETLPYGVFTTANAAPRVGVRVVDRVFDLAAIGAAVAHPHADVFAARSLNPLMELGSDQWPAIRTWVRSLFDDGVHRHVVTQHAHAVDEVRMLLPIEVADYVDFYASEQHARNVGAIFRPDSPDLPPNWKHLPIGYHGRSGTVVVSGTPITRPRGQRRPGPDGPPVFAPTSRLDIECEIGFIIGQASDLGTPVSLADARSHLFGVVLLNDWSARDIQAWEYTPLGPFLGKSFGTSISAWVVPWEALSHAHVDQPPQDPEVVAYLAGSPAERAGLDLHLEVAVNGHVVSRPEFKDMYWSPAQMLAHMTVNGASLRVGDLFGSGTVSGAQRSSFGSLLELTWNGSDPLRLDAGPTRGYLEDGDTVTISGWAPGPAGSRVTLGEVAGTVRPARQ